jgi:hypothetical protein
MVYIGKVISITNDENDGERIKVRIKNVDDRTNDLADAFPLLPKMFHVKPKVGEAVFVICSDESPNSQRYYLGPIISQYQNMYKDYYDFGATKLMGGRGTLNTAVGNTPKTHGAFAAPDDIAIYGRKNSDIILGDSDIKIRCGAHLVNKLDTTDIGFNKTNPSFIKLKYHESPLDVKKPYWNGSDFEYKGGSQLESSVNIVAQEINLISTDSGDPYLNTANTGIKNSNTENDGNESIKDEDLAKFIQEAHPLPYGDTLIKFLYVFVQAFKNHTHRYHQMTPVPDITYNNLDSFDLNGILSKNVRIN